jgi:hypothetical protein
VFARIPEVSASSAFVCPARRISSLFKRVQLTDHIKTIRIPFVSCSHDKKSGDIPQFPVAGWETFRDLAACFAESIEFSSDFPGIRLALTMAVIVKATRRFQ